MDALGRGGLGAASVAELARAASIAKGSFYAFYASKEELFMEALESIEDGYRERFAKAAAGGGSPLERLRRAFTAAFRMIDEEPALRYVDAATTERLARALPPERVARHGERDAAAIARIAEDWRSEGLLAEGVGELELAGAGYAVFLVSMGLRNLPEALKEATETVAVRGLALALCGGPVPVASPEAASAAVSAGPEPALRAEAGKKGKGS